MASIASILADEIHSQIKQLASIDSQTRLIGREIPMSTLEMLVESQDGKGFDLPDGDQLPMVVADKASTASIDIDAPVSGIYNQNQITRLRNHSTLGYVLLLPSGVAGLPTLMEAAGFLPDPISNVVDRIFRDIFSGDPAIAKTMADLLERVVSVKGRSNSVKSHERWRLAARLADLGASGGIQETLAILGLPACKEPADLNLSDYRRLVPLLAEEASKEGLLSFFGRLHSQGEAQPDTSEDQLTALDQCLAHLKGKAKDGATWEAYPYERYAPTFDPLNAASLPSWWTTLDYKTWKRLLDDGGPKTSDHKLVVDGRTELCSVGSTLVYPKLSGLHARLSPTPDPKTDWELKSSRTQLDSKASLAQYDLPETGHSSPVQVYAHPSGGGNVLKSKKFVGLSSFEPAIVVHAAQSDKCSIPRKGAGDGKYIADIEFPDFGEYRCHLWLANGCSVESIKGFDTETDAEGEQIEVTFSSTSENDVINVSFNLVTDANCRYEISYSKEAGDQALLSVTVVASDENQTQEQTVYDALVREHISKKGSRPQVTANRNSSLLHTIQAWKVEDKSKESFWPGAISLTMHPRSSLEKPESWKAWQLSRQQLDEDPRPSPDDWSPPATLVEAWNEARELILRSSGDAAVVEACRLGEVWRNKEDRTKLLRYLELYSAWLSENPQDARWWETIILLEPVGEPASLLASPTCLLLSPLHPARLLWQANVQGLLEESIDKGDRVPLLASLDPSHCPSTWELPGPNDNWRFIALGQPSTYWTLLWNESDAPRAIRSEPVLDAVSSLGLATSKLSPSISSSHVHGILDDLVELKPAKGNMQVEVLGQDGTREIERGILGWFDQYTLPDDSRRSDPKHDFLEDWIPVSPLRLMVHGTNGAPEPDSALLAGFAERRHGRLRWHATRKTAPPNSDVVIVASLPTSSFVVRRDWPKGSADPWFMCAARPDSPTASGSIQSLEVARFHDGGNNGVASGFTLQSEGVRKSFDTAAFLALPAGTFAPPQLQSQFGKTGVVWKIEHPDYHGVLGNDKGYVVVANASEGIRKAVKQVVDDMAGESLGVSEATVDVILSDYGQRGLDSLHHLMDQSVDARGSLGLLASVRILQGTDKFDGILPDDTDDVVVFVIPLDPFRKKLETLRKAAGEKGNPRPDLLVLAVSMNGDSPSVKLTPIEVKCRKGVLPMVKCAEHLAGQCRRFSNLLKTVFIDLPDDSKGWSVGARLLLVELAAFGAAIRGQLRENWSGAAGAKRLARVQGALLGKSLAVDVCNSGRLMVIDGSESTKFQHRDTDFDSDGFLETLQVNRREAARMLAGEELSVPQRDDHWDLLPSKPGTPLPDWPWEANVSSCCFPDTPDSKAASANVVAKKRDQDDSKTPKKQVEEAATPKPKPESAPGPGQPEPEREPPDPKTGSNTDELPQPCITLGCSDTDQPISWSPYGLGGKPRLNNGHVVVIGSSGAGKTYLLKNVVSKPMAECGVPMLLVDFNDDFTESEFVDAINGTIMSAQDGLALNPLEAPMIPGQGGIRVNYHIYELQDIFKAAFGLGEQQAADFRKALIATYANAGINPSQKLLKSPPDSWPTFEDLKPHLEALGNAEMLNRVLPLFDLEVFTGSSQGIGESLTSTKILSLSHLPSDMVKRAIADLFLKSTYQYLLRCGHAQGLRLAIVIDEAHKVANLPSTATLLKEARKFGASIWVSSQEPKDFNDTVWSNCGTQVFFRIDELLNAKKSAKQLGQADMAEDMRSLEVGNAFLRNLHYQPFVRFKAGSKDCKS